MSLLLFHQSKLLLTLNLRPILNFNLSFITILILKCFITPTSLMTNLIFTTRLRSVFILTLIMIFIPIPIHYYLISVLAF